MPYAVTATLLIPLVAGCFALVVFAGYEVRRVPPLHLTRNELGGMPHLGHPFAVHQGSS